MTSPAELLNALLDGELSPDDETEVRAWLDEHPDGQRELDDLRRVRTLVRSLPAVDPPFGFYERMLLDSSADSAAATSVTSPRSTPVAHKPRANRRRRTWAATAGGIAAAAAAVVLVLGITPVTDKVVPPVNAFAERHDSMAAGAATPASTSTTSSSSTAPPSGPDSPSDGYHTVADDTLDSMAAPYLAPAKLDGYGRASVYASRDIVHVVYAHNGLMLSMYEQPGTVDWTNMPGNGHRLTVKDDPAWETTRGNEAVLVIDRDGVVLTIVSSAPPDDMMRAVSSVPQTPEPSMMTRMQRGSANVVRSFGLG